MIERIRAGVRRNALIIIIWISVAITWIVAYLVGVSSFDKTDAISIHGSIIQGMSAILSVAIAVIIFRIQTLENRNQALEQSTLNYIHQIARLTVPKWGPSVEESIENGNITNRYFNNRIWVEQQNGTLTSDPIKELERDRDDQQRRLMNALTLHRNTISIIQRTRTDFIATTFLMGAPIILSLLMLMMSKALSSQLNFVIITMEVLGSALGIISLISVVIKSTRYIRIQ